jgi:hypothetical protein
MIIGRRLTFVQGEGTEVLSESVWIKPIRIRARIKNVRCGCFLPLFPRPAQKVTALLLFRYATRR